MIDPTRLPASPPQSTHPPKAVFRMISSDRMAGSVPAWVPPETAQDQALSQIGDASGGRIGDAPDDAMAYRQTGAARDINEEPFGFGDLLDIINPLQHIPLVGTFYREITGDQIRPSSQILGGAVFGGIAGAAGSLVNVIIEEETGKDIAGNVIAMVMPDQPDPEAPLQKLAAASTEEAQDFPATALSFVDLAHKEPSAPPKRQQWKFNE